MPAPFGNLESKLEAATAAYLSATFTPLSIAATIYTGKGNADKGPPAIICEATSGPELEPNTAIFDITCKVTVRTAAAIDTDTVDPKPADDILIASISDAVLIANLQDILTYYGTDLSVQGIVFGEVESSENGDCWDNSISFRAMCRGQ